MTDPQQALYEQFMATPPTSKGTGLGQAYYRGLEAPDQVPGPRAGDRRSLAYAAWLAGRDTARTVNRRTEPMEAFNPALKNSTQFIRDPTRKRHTRIVKLEHAEQLMKLLMSDGTSEKDICTAAGLGGSAFSTARSEGQMMLYQYYALFGLLAERTKDNSFTTASAAVSGWRPSSFEELVAIFDAARHMLKVSPSRAETYKHILAGIAAEMARTA